MGRSTRCVQAPVAAGVYTVVVCSLATSKPLRAVQTTPEYFPLPPKLTPQPPKSRLALLTIQRKLNSPRNSSEDRTWYFIVF